jgi:hypothetical protein
MPKAIVIAGETAGTESPGPVAADTPKLTGAGLPLSGTKRSGLSREGLRSGLADHGALDHFCPGSLP